MQVDQTNICFVYSNQIKIYLLKHITFTRGKTAYEHGQEGSKEHLQ